MFQEKGNVWAARLWCAVLWEQRAHHRVTGRWGLISEKDHRSWRALWFILRGQVFILMVMRSSLEDFRQRNDAKISLAFDCFVSCLLVTSHFFPLGNPLLIHSWFTWLDGADPILGYKAKHCTSLVNVTNSRNGIQPKSVRRVFWETFCWHNYERRIHFLLELIK